MKNICVQKIIFKKIKRYIEIDELILKVNTHVDRLID